MKTLAKLIYLEADEEVTDLVDRLRELQGEDAVTLVVPDRPRALQSTMSFRLLKRYAQSFSMRLNVISADPRIQGLSLESGFSAYPTVEAYDRGAEVLRPATELQAPPEPPEAIQATTRPLLSGAARRSAPLPPAFLADQDRQPRRPPWRLVAAAGIAVLLAALGALLYLPTASVTVAVAGTKLENQVQLVGAPTAAGAPGRFQTRALEATAAQTAQGKATGTKQVAAAFATGEVTISNNRVTDLTYPRFLCVSTSDDIQFQLDRDLRLERGKEGTVRVTAFRSGSNFNVDAGRIAKFCDFRWAVFGSVTNPAAISGGAEARVATVVEENDITTARQALLDTLDPKVRNDLNAKAAAAGLHVAPESLEIKPTVNADHRAGEEAGSFTITATVNGKATAFDDAAVRTALADALKQRVPPGKELTENPIAVSYKVASATPDGNLTLDGIARAFTRPIFSAADIRARTAGKSPSVARAQLRQLPSAVDVSVRQEPVSLPWLPFFSSRIRVRILAASSG